MKVENEKMGFEETELRLGLPGNKAGAKATAAAATEGDVVMMRKRGFSESTDTVDLMLNLSSKKEPTNSGTDPTDKPKTTLLSADPAKPPAKAQVVGWPPVRSYRKNMLAVQQKSNGDDDNEKNNSINANNNGSFVKVSMDGAPYLRKVDLNMYKTYQELSDSLRNMFSSFTIAGNCGSQGMKEMMMNESKVVDILNGSDYVPTYEDKDGDWMLVGDVPWEMFVESCKRLRIVKGKEAIGLAPRAMEKCKNRS